MSRRATYWPIILAILIGAGALRIWDPAPIARLRLLVFDSFQQISPRAYDPALPVRIVDVDDASLEKIGQWPWARTKMAEIVRRLTEAGAAVIAFDIVFPEPDRLSPEALGAYPSAAGLSGNDAVFAKAIAQSRVALGFILGKRKGAAAPQSKAGFAFAGDDPKLFVPAFPGYVASLEGLQTPAVGSGALNWLPEYDQIIRRLPLLFRLDDQLFPALSAEALRVAQGASTYLVKSSGASGEEAFGAKTGVVSVRIGALTVPTDAEGQMWLQFTKSEPRRFIPAWTILSGTFDKAEVEGKIILVGTSAAGLFDLRTTPLDASAPGVEIHAQAIEQMLLGSFLLRPDFATAAELLVLIIAGLLLAFAIDRAGARVTALVGAAFVGLVFGLSWLAFKEFKWLADPVYPAICFTLVYLAGTVLVYLRSEADRRQIRSAFSHYMAPALVEELASDPSRLKLGGETRDMTLLFSDVRGFTTISEGLTAEQLTTFINSLFTPLSNVILEARGTIDKYMGDAVMAFWNAPLDDPDHPRNACRAALGMIDSLETLNRDWRAEAEANGQDYKPVALGVGINTGDCCVGNLGSEQRFDYSVIGDNVNVASRLEGQTKTYGVAIVVGGETAARAPEFALLEIDLLQVKGKHEAVHVFGLLGAPDYRQSEGFAALKSQHEAFLASYRARDWDGAEAMIEACEGLADGKLGELYQLYRKRIARHRILPPPDDWDGSASAESK